ncbi:MAG: hypothetical protein HY064_09155 [Bacteroidetes bacterium]|nr:hypothetical protein [Bacteroidota bacterium]
MYRRSDNRNYEIKTPFIHLNDLIISKRTAGRNVDKIDVDELQRIQRRNLK